LDHMPPSESMNPSFPNSRMKWLTCDRVFPIMPASISKVIYRAADDYKRSGLAEGRSEPFGPSRKRKMHGLGLGRRHAGVYAEAPEH